MASATALAAGANRAAHALGNSADPDTSAPISPAAKKSYDLGQLKWQVIGITPYLWKIDNLKDIRHAPDAEVGPIDASVPGSVQLALLQAGLLLDWNLGLNARAAEWVENRDWVYQTQIPDEWIAHGKQFWLRCAGLDYKGHILLNGVSVLPFDCGFLPYEVDLKTHLQSSGNLLQIWFQPPPRWLGEYGYTSRVKDWKPRFNYYWDWTSRLVQIGVWDSITLDTVDAGEILSFHVTPSVVPESKQGSLNLSVQTSGGKLLHVALKQGSRTLREQTINAGGAISWTGLPVELWWPNGMGEQPLYTIQIQLLDDQKRLLDARQFRAGFRLVEWQRTQGAPEQAFPFLCVVNDKPVFLFGVNWTPIRPNFADLQESDYRKRIAAYRDLGANVLRVWGGGFPEKQWFYDLCDEMGLVVCQEFPLSSSGLDNYPPDDPSSIADLAVMAKSYIRRMHNHPSLVLWSGGNELLDNLHGHESPQPSLTIAHHPMIVSLSNVVQLEDPQHAFVPTAPFGPVGVFTRETIGKQQHWDVHGPYVLNGLASGEWTELWKLDDAMFHSETGCPAASSVDIIRRFKGNVSEWPATHDNPLWNRQPWWVEWDKYVQEKGQAPANLEEYVAWSQQRQADALGIALTLTRARFPACGGLVLWMGHDAFPCTANLSIIDYDGNPKPSAIRFRQILRNGA